MASVHRRVGGEYAEIAHASGVVGTLTCSDPARRSAKAAEQLDRQERRMSLIEMIRGWRIRVAGCERTTLAISCFGRWASPPYVIRDLAIIPISSNSCRAAGPMALPRAVVDAMAIQTSLLDFDGDNDAERLRPFLWLPCVLMLGSGAPGVDLWRK
jgi:hypothetical protein